MPVSSPRRRVADGQMARVVDFYLWIFFTVGLPTLKQGETCP